MYAHFQLLCPQAQENTNLACMDKPADTLAVTAAYSREVRTGTDLLVSLIKHGTHVDGVNSLVKLLS